MTNDIYKFFQRTGVKRFLIFSIIIFVLFLIGSIINIVLLTFIFSFLINGLEQFITKRIPINRKVTVLAIYVAAVSLLVYGAVKYLPIIINEVTQLFHQLADFYSKPISTDNVILNYIFDLLEKYNISNYLETGVTVILKFVNDIGTVGLQVFIALILSLFFLLEKERIIVFTNKFQHSKISSFYNEIKYFGGKFANTFGKVIEAQFIIASVNMFITTVFLWFLHFPNLFGLAIMVFCLGLIPVAGVIISLIPLCFIAYSIGGLMHVVYILIMVAVVHAIEAYVLNPKLMSSKTNLPVFYTFIVLIFGEHFFGVWGLILGIPIFVFLLDVLGVKTLDPAAKPVKSKK
ncbi:AI-2E family transporter [Caldibacillus lycopersici]|uniref:AI-2E family transporter n=1 Tax=Perspicuibacillus lycopersici TaxID=1325689 RepID=A0AAE3IZW1_9BACI|nr:AI-2E family transporter [Perspicuibacillus lycopersici]MCU9615105.1 AI-2E family transporter [Perspicuibacillus lycopersici]